MRCHTLLRWTMADLNVTTRQWREAQAEQIKARDEASKQKRQETIAKAERSIDQFYEDYNSKKERNIRENKYVIYVHLTHEDAN